jgi:cytochrome c peroxidase
VRLGQKLFFDKRMSVDGSKACFDCHLNEDGTGGHDPLAIGIGNKPLPRHAPAMWNVAYLPKLYWDGRADSLEAVVKGAWGGAGMGIGADNLGKKAAEIGALPEYSAEFERLFPESGASPDTIAQAIASYQRTLFCGDTAYDRFSAGDNSALTSEQKAGWDLFKGKAGCTNCHVPPFFSDAYLADAGAFHNTGIGTEGKAEKDVDVGRMKVSENPAEWAAFKTPSLRNIAKTPPYFHDGSRATLKEAVAFMASGGRKNKNLDPRLQDKKLTPAEIDSLVAFLVALDCGGKLSPPGG